MYQRLLYLLLLLPLASQAQENRAPWLQPDVLKAAGDIGLTAEQQPLFRNAITHLVENQIAATNKLLRRNNIADLKRKLTTVTNRQFKKMDQEMAGFLTPEQIPQYQIYRDALRAHMARSTVRRGRSSSAAVNDTERSLEQGAIQHH
ncbi:MAG: hypothetical protein ACFHXK_06210 [bacterium]